MPKAVRFDREPKLRSALADILLRLSLGAAGPTQFANS
jgi:hypothetical protein